MQVPWDLECNLRQLIRQLVCFALLVLSLHLSPVLGFKASSSLDLIFHSFLMVNAKSRMTQLPDYFVTFHNKDFFVTSRNKVSWLPLEKSLFLLQNENMIGCYE